MKIPKKIKDMPWPEEFRHDGNDRYRITVERPIVDHERLLVVTFMPNQERRVLKTIKFRIICSKKQKDFATIELGGKTTRQTIQKVLSKTCQSVSGSYVMISEKEESILKAWLGNVSSVNHFLPELNRWMEAAAEERVQRQKRERGEIMDDAVNLCPNELPEGLEAWVRREIIGRDDTLIYKKGNVRGLCYACGRQVRANMTSGRFMQYRGTRCPDCGTSVMCVLAAGDRFRNHYVQNIVAMQKGTDGKTVFFRQWHVLRDPEARYENVSKWLQEIGRYAIRGNKVAKWLHEYKENYYTCVDRYRLESWQRIKGAEVYDGEYVFFSASAEEAVSGTKLQYADIIGYYRADNADARASNIIRYAMDWARYPVMEYLWKAGFRGLAFGRVGCMTKENRDAIRWMQTTLKNCFRFPLHLLKAKPPEDWSLDDVAKLNKLWAMHQEGHLAERDVVELMAFSIDYNTLRPTMQYAPLRKIIKYLSGQIEGAPRAVENTFRDYIQECEQLGLDLTQKEILFPRDLVEAHNRTMAQVTFQKNKADQAKFAAAAEKLEKLAWEQDGLIIRPAREQVELQEEGAALHHCVGGYIQRMADGETAIFFVRRAEKPAEPFYTLELQNKKVTQCRTTNNKSHVSDERVKAFVDAWVTEVVRTNGKPKKKRKTSVA